MKYDKTVLETVSRGAREMAEHLRVLDALPEDSARTWSKE